VNASAGERNTWNTPRFRPGTTAGHYESWFQRANHPTRPLAFWIRYTIFCPKGRPEESTGELWAVFFDGEHHRVTAVKSEVPLADCRFGARGIDLEIGAATLANHALVGSAASRGHEIGWSLEFESEMPTLLLLPDALYERRFPKAKALVGFPNAIFRGWLTVDGHRIAVENWQGSQNHNWGSRHTDSYAWGQVAGFDDDDRAFLECSTAQVKIGPFWTPRLSLVVLRTRGEEFALNTMGRALLSRGRFEFFDWRISTAAPAARMTVRLHAPRTAFTALTYRNPPGGSKTCLNSKIATCEVTLEVPGRPARTLKAARRAAFEILTDRTDHGVPVAG
jgi:hypothetical protein